MSNNVIKELVRPHLQDMKSYSSARDEYSGKSEVYLDANENALGSVGTQDLTRYPDPHQREIKTMLSDLKHVSSNQIFIGNGSDEPIDLLIRAFCEPGKHEIMIFPPTYGMYEVSANINQVGLNKVSLTTDFQLDIEKILSSITDRTRIMFICNPNNPTGTRIKDIDILTLLERFNGLIVVDEAYIDFSDKESFVSKIGEYDRLAVLQTFSKAWGLAAARVGMLFGNQDIVSVLNKIKPPYNVNELSQRAVIYALNHVEEKEKMVQEILMGRDYLTEELQQLEIVRKIYASDANFLLVKLPDPVKMYQFLIAQGIIVRDRSKVELCEGCLRITVGTKQENQRLLSAMKAYN